MSWATGRTLVAGQCCCVWLSLLLLTGLAGAALGQISPGALSQAHEPLDNPLKCANCHVFGAGKPQLKCLGCHAEIATRLARGKGYHAQVVKTRNQSACAECHTEHYGRGFNIMPWPKSRDEFEHRKTGWPLEGKHAGLECEKCHQARYVPKAARASLRRRDYNRTYLGLPTGCGGCHEDRHAGQLGPDCARCHSQGGWKDVTRFSHAASKYPLTGRHGQVTCEKCHKREGKNVAYRVPFQDCAPCHQDPHKGAFKQACSQCHNTDTFRGRVELAGFDHGRTRYPLRGKHTEVSCAKCHKSSDFHVPMAHARCLDCHREEHGPQFRARADGGDCGACHTEEGYKPATYKVAEHKASDFPLTGRHAATPCAKCHPGAGIAVNYRPRHGACIDCHPDAHKGQFQNAPWKNGCQLCHGTDAFRPSTFRLANHQATRYPLAGAHEAVPCGDCHKAGAQGTALYRFTATDCTVCHQDPHGLKPGADCASCHGVQQWRLVRRFDHSRTAFPLEGAHMAVVCAACHKPRRIQADRRVPFASTPRVCDACHDDPHGGQFITVARQSGCDLCHSSARWKPAQFNHDSSYPLTGAHRGVACRQCHLIAASADGRPLARYRGTPRKCSACHT
jgi:hypothetical protein